MLWNTAAGLLNAAEAYLVIGMPKQREKQSLFIFEITVLCLAGTFLCGVEVFLAVFAADLALYKKELLLLVVTGGMLVLSGYVSVIYTVMRRQGVLLAIYIVNTAIASFAMPQFVRNGGIRSAAIGELVSFAIHVFVFYMGLLVCFYFYRRSTSYRVG